MGSLVRDPDALSLDWAPCSAPELEASRAQILQNLELWKAEKRCFVGSEAEFENEEVRAHLTESSEDFCARVSGRISGQGMWGSNTDLALYALYTPVLVVVIRADLVTPSSSFVDDDKAACSELWFDPLVEAVKTRVVCVILDRHHFQLGVVRTPQIRAVFQRGADWDEARHLILAFIKARPSRGSLGPPWAPAPSVAALPCGSTDAALVPCPRSVPQASREESKECSDGVKDKLNPMHATHYTTQHSQQTPYT